MRVVALGGHRARNQPVGERVLLLIAAGHRQRHRRGYRHGAEDAADEAHDATVPREARLVAIEAGDEEAARLQEQAAESARPGPLRLEHRQAAEARAHPDREPGHRDVLADRGQDPVAQCPAVRRRRRVPLVPIAGRQKRDSERPDRAALDHRARVPGERGQFVVFRPVVGDQQRQLALGRRPDADRQIAAEHTDADLIELAGERGRLEPPGRPVAGRRQHRLLAERARGARSGLPGSHTTIVSASWSDSSSWYSSRATPVDGSSSTQPPSSLTNSGSASGRSERNRTAANRCSGSSTRRLANTGPEGSDRCPARWATPS